MKEVRDAPCAFAPDRGRRVVTLGVPPRLAPGPQPTLYLHGGDDGCIGVELVGGADRQLAPGSRMLVVEGAGHFPHLERPEEVNQHILAWVAG